MPAKPGRPKNDVQARKVLIDAARNCFLHNHYDRVSLRQIAHKADVDPGMIRYYFGSKAGLFETMVRETFAPVIEMLRKNSRSPGDSPVNLMTAYYQMMASSPALPRLVFQVLHQQSNPQAYEIISTVFREIFGSASEWVFLLAEQQQLNPNLDPNLAKLSFVSLMVFPLVAPKLLLDELGLSMSPEMLDKLLQHNSQVMSQGIFRSPLSDTNQSGVEQ